MSEMFWRPIQERIAALRRMVKRLERTPDASPHDIAELKRIMSKRIAELEAKKPASEQDDASRPTRRAA
jgi:hypothetical protein